MFVHKNSRYIGSFFIAGCTSFGYLLYRRYKKAYNSFRYFYNYSIYPKDIKKMIDNNDARYAYRWLKDNYL